MYQYVIIGMCLYQTSSVPATQGESVAMDTPISSNHNSLSTVWVEPV